MHMYVSIYIYMCVCVYIYITCMCRWRYNLFQVLGLLPTRWSWNPPFPPVVWVGVGGGLNTIYYKEPLENQTRRRHKNPIQRGPAVAHQGAAHRQVLSCSWCSLNQSTWNKTTEPRMTELEIMALGRQPGGGQPGQRVCCHPFYRT